MSEEKELPIALTGRVTAVIRASFEDHGAGPSRDQVHIEILTPARLSGRTLNVVIDREDRQILAAVGPVSFTSYPSDLEFGQLFSGALDNVNRPDESGPVPS